MLTLMSLTSIELRNAQVLVRGTVCARSMPPT